MDSVEELTSTLWKKTYCCKHCDCVSDRDFNGARNILIRHLTLYNKRALETLEHSAAYGLSVGDHRDVGLAVGSNPTGSNNCHLA